MKIVTATVSYHTVGAEPPYDFEVQFLFHTQSGKTYLVQTTTDAINWTDHPPITFPPHTQLVIAVDPKVGPWPRLVAKD